MKIFNVELFYSDLDWFLSQEKEVKKQWILENTNQTNEILIDEFIENNKVETNNDCFNCGQLNNKIENPFKDANNITSGNDAEGQINIEPDSAKGNSKRTVSKSRGRDKTA